MEIRGLYCKQKGTFHIIKGGNSTDSTLQSLWTGLKECNGFEALEQDPVSTDSFSKQYNKETRNLVNSFIPLWDSEVLTQLNNMINALTL